MSLEETGNTNQPKFYEIETVDLQPAVIVDMYDLAMLIRSMKPEEMTRENWFLWESAIRLAAKMVGQSLNQMLLWTGDMKSSSLQRGRSIPDIVHLRPFWVRLYMWLTAKNDMEGNSRARLSDNFEPTAEVLDAFIADTEARLCSQYLKTMKPILEAVKPPSWRIWTLRTVTTNIILVDMGDYRIVEWHRMMAEKHAAEE